MPKQPRKFEDAFSRLSEIVEQLEAGEAGLEESLALYAEGMKLAKLCGEKLSEAEKKIERLSADLKLEAGGLLEDEDDDGGDDDA